MRSALVTSVDQEQARRNASPGCCSYSRQSCWILSKVDQSLLTRLIRFTWPPEHVLINSFSLALISHRSKARPPSVVREISIAIHGTFGPRTLHLYAIRLQVCCS